MKRPIEAVIEEVIVEPSKIQPIIVNFQNGKLKDDEAEKMSCGLFFDQEKRKTVLAMSNGHIVYKGFKPDTTKDLTRTMLVIRNKRTGTCKLIEAERWQVSPLLEKPQIEDGTDLPNDRVYRLNKQFGSKKVKRRTEQYERMKINVDLVKEQLEETVANVKVDRVDLMDHAPGDEYITNTNLPEINRDASNAKEVYNIYDIVPKDKMEGLYETAKEILENDTQRRSRFFVQALNYIKANPSNKIEKLALLLYIDATAAWLNMPIKDAKRRGTEICPYSQEINKYIINCYSVASAHGRLRPNSMKDKAIIHCLILALVIFDYTMNLEVFSTIFSARTGMKKLMDLVKIIAATPEKTDKNIISLKLPLPAKAAVVSKRKKK